MRNFTVLVILISNKCNHVTVSVLFAHIKTSEYYIYCINQLHETIHLGKILVDL